MVTLDLADLTADSFWKTASPPITASLRGGQSLLVQGGCGCGKSALAQEICGLRPGRGTVTLNGKDVSGLSSRERATLIGYVPTDPTLLFSGVGGTLQEEVMVGWSLLGRQTGELASWVDQLLDELDVQRLMHRDPLTLSGGERARAALLLVLIKAPRVLVLDDVYGAFDPDMRQRVRAVIKGWLAQWQGVLVEFHSTPPHYQTEFDARADLELGAEPSTGSDKASANSYSALRTRVVQLNLVELRYKYSAEGFALHVPCLNLSGGLIYVVSGPNGAGKSTLMRCIGLLQQPSYQVFTVADGQSLDPHRPPAIRELHTWPTVVSYGFQDAALQLYCATVEEELRQTAKNLKKQIDPADWRWILAALRLGAHLDRPTADLPLPLKRLVLIASLLLCQPAVLILDEPTVALDSRQKRDLRSVLKDYAASGRLVMMVSHDQDFVEDLGRAISVASVGAVEVKKIE